MKAIYSSILLSACIPASGFAASVFSNVVDTDFNNVANWDNGLPSNDSGPGLISAGSDAVMTGDYLMRNNGSPSVTEITVDGTLSTGANELQLRSGGVGRTSDLIVTGLFTVNSGGEIDIAGGGADLFLSSGGDMVVESGGTFAASKAVDIGSGSVLTFQSGALSGSSLNDELQLRNESTLAFEVAADGTFFTLNGSNLQVRLGSTPNLAVEFAGVPLSGTTYDLITGVSGFTDYQGNGSGYTFDPGNVAVSGLGAGQSYQLNYTDGLQLEIVPEPSSTALLGLGGLALILRRRK